MNVQSLSLTPNMLLRTLGGPALVGASSGMVLGLGAMLRGAVALPLVVIGVALLMLPALYIASALIGAAPSASAVLEAAGQALADIGTVLLGLGPALGFLIATVDGLSAARMLTVLVVLLAASLGLRSFYLRLYHGADLGQRALAVFLAWSAVGLGIGWHLLTTTSPIWGGAS